MYDRIIRLGFLLLFALVPLLLTPWNYELFEYNKMMAVYALTVAIVSSWLIKSLAQKEFRIAKTPLDIPILLFLGSQLFSSFFSIDPHVSWFGYYSRFNGGMWSVISYVLLYYAFATNKPNLTPMIKAMLSTATVVALYGVAERLGIDKNLWVQDVQNRVFSTLGQPNWLAAYLVALIPLTFTFRSPISYLLSILFFTVLLFTRSRSGLLGFAVADIVFWGLVYWKTKAKNSLRIPLPRRQAGFFMCHVSCVILFLIFGSQIQLFKKPDQPQTYTAPVLESGGTESGVIRKYVWQGAINAWNSSWKTRLIGTGTETFAFAFYQFRPPEHNETSEWDFLYNKAHNEYLNYLATTGLFGLGSYLLFIGAFLYWFMKNKMQEAIGYAIFAGWVSLLVTNFFGFSVVITQIFFFLFPAMLIASQAGKTRTLKIKFPNWVLWIPVLIGAYVLGKIGVFWHADTLFAKGYRLSRGGSYEQSHTLLERAVWLNPKEPLYHDELATALSGRTVAAIETQEATPAAKFAQGSIKENDTALMISPKNVNFWKSRTKIFYAFSAFDAQFNSAAIGALEHSLALSPNDPKIVYNLAILFGREGNNEKTIELLKKAIDLKRDYRDAYWALSIFYTEAKQPKEARAILEEYLDRVDPNDKDFQQKIAQ